MKLKLSEEFVLIALDDAKGKFMTDSISLHHGLAGALLLDLAIAGKAHIEENRMVLHDTSLSGDPVLDIMIDFIRKPGRDHTIRYWIRKTGLKGRALKNMLLDQLVEKGILVKEKGTILWIFSTNKYLPINATPENLVKEKLKNIVLHNETADTQNLLLLSLISSCKLVKEVFRNKEEYKIAKKRIAEITHPDVLGKAVNEAIRGIHAAVTAAVMASTVATTAASSN